MLHHKTSPTSASVGPLGRLRLIFAMLLLTLVSGCATTVITPELEEELGTEMSVQVKDQIGLYADADLDRYLQSVGNRLVAALGATPYTFRFAIVDQFEPNAFASPGGVIYVSRGLMSQMNNEAELAGVLAHEISHVTQRHHARQIGRSVGAGLFTLPGKAVGVVSQDLGNIINAPIEAAGQVYLASYSRGQESEADAYGMRLAAGAGYNPRSLADALSGIERTVEALTGEKHKASFFDSHPTTPTRVADIATESATLTVAPVPPIADQRTLYGYLDGMWVGSQNPQQGIVAGRDYLNADLDFSITFPDKWETMNTPRFVAAAQPDGGAYLALGGSDAPGSITEIIEGMAQKMREDAGIEPAERRALTVGSWPAEVLRYDDTSGDQTISLYYMLVQSPREKFMLVAMGYEEFRDVLGNSALTLGPLTDVERNKIGGLRLRIAEPRGGESLTALGQRTGSKWPPQLAAAINGLASKTAPIAGRPIKFSRVERYTAAGR
ncbi:MAG: M48 family metalloprotease [Halieaceae bacterium]